MVINIMVSNHTPDELLNLPSLKSNLAGLLVYSERHMQRFEANSCSLLKAKND